MPADTVSSAEASRVPTGAPPSAQRWREISLFLILAVVIWPFIAVGVVGGWGLVVWMYFALTGPPGPV